MGKRHITVSTVGIVPAIKNLLMRISEQGLHFLCMPLMKNRKKLIPNNLGFSIEDILAAGKYYLKKTNSRLTIEYILVKKINDNTSDAHKLTRLLKNSGLFNPDVQINLIPYNPVDETGFETPSDESIQRFYKILKLNGFTVNIRQAKGADISAACGQLGY